MVQFFLGLHGVAAALVVLVVPMLEASTLLGMVLPGELAVVLGGVLAYFGRLSLPVAIGAATIGAIVGDSIGYYVGLRMGERVLHTRVGRWIGKRRWERARRHLRRKGFWAVVIARFPPLLRSLVPCLAGMARMPYRRFLAANVAGALAWASASVAVGYLAGAEWRRVIKGEHWVLGVMMGAIAVAALVWWWRHPGLRRAPRSPAPTGADGALLTSTPRAAAGSTTAAPPRRPRPR